MRSHPFKVVRSNFMDLAGIFSSFICIIHCVAGPLLLALGAGFMLYPWFKYVFVSVAFVAIYHATSKGTPRRIALLLWVSFWGMLTSLFLEEEFPVLEYTGYLSSAGIMIGHLLNIRYCRKCRIK